jgi:pimeloyl-ACP methyl ester carboxylesterase
MSHMSRDASSEVSVPTRDGTLAGTLFYPRQPAILFIHGWASSQEGYLPRARALSALGFICLTFDLRGHGDSPRGGGTTATRKEFFDDVLAAYDFLISRPGVGADRVGVVGASFGGYLGSLLTARRRVRWLALRAPANNPDAELGSAFEAVRRFAGELLLIESERDEVIPHEVVEGYRIALGDNSR